MFCLFDESIMKNLEAQGLRRSAAYGGMQMRKGSTTAWMPSSGLGKGLKEIANWIGTRPETLKKLLKNIMPRVKKALTLFSARIGVYLLPLRSTPYYAIQDQAMICDAIGGIKINENMEVVNADDDLIPGLFAAG
jgi:hypothetical protein